MSEKHRKRPAAERRARKKLGFPEEGQLVFYTDPRDENSRTDILDWSVVEKRKGYSIIKVRTRDKVYEKMHSGIVAFMQRSDYVSINCR